MYQSANILPSLRSASLALASVLLAFSHFGVPTPAHAALGVHDGYAPTPSARMVTGTDKTIRRDALNRQAAGQQTITQRSLIASSIQQPGRILVSRNSQNRIQRNPGLELYEKRKNSPPVIRRPEVDLIKPQERIEPPDYRNRLKRNRNNRITPPSRLGRDPLSSNIDCRGGIVRQGSCHCRGRDVLRQVAGNVYACVTRPLEQP